VPPLESPLSLEGQGLPLRSTQCPDRLPTAFWWLGGVRDIMGACDCFRESLRGYLSYSNCGTR
jgi:hypothetical protein